MKDRQRYCWNLLAFICIVTVCAAQPSLGLVVTEVMYNATADSDELEFIELYNNRAVFEDITGYQFTNGIDYLFDTETIIGPKEYLVIAQNPAALEAAYGISDVKGPFTGRLNNDGERIELSNANGEIVISFRYNDVMQWPVSPDGAGHSLILARQGGDPEEPATWSASTYIGGTPGRPDEVQIEPEDPTLVTLIDLGHPGRYFKGIREPSPGPGGTITTDWTRPEFNDNPQSTAWLDGPNGYGYSNSSDELQFIRTQLNDMSGNYMSVYARLRFDLTAEQINSFSQLWAEVHYDDGFVLYLNGVRVGDSGQIAGNPPPFDQSGGTATDPPVANVNLTSHMNLLRSGVNVLAIQAHNANISGSSDCLGCPILQAIIEVSSDGDDPRARLLVNELLANSDLPPGFDWIELYNPGPIAVNLGNVYLSDNPLDLLQYKIPDGIVLQPGQFWAVTEGMEPDGFEFGLDFSGETVYLTAATSGPNPQPLRILDAVRYGPVDSEVTIGRFPDGSDFFNFLSSATFQAPNAGPLVNDIVINEIMYHHGTRDERYEYIELYNRSMSTVSLDSWAFTNGISYDFEKGTEIRPNSYLVIASDPNLLESVYDNLTVGQNLVGPYSGNLNDHSETIRLSYPLDEINSDTGKAYMVIADEVTYFDGGRWPMWADGQGASLELRDPHGNNNAPGAWADSDESSKTTWENFSITINGSDSRYTHDQVNVFDFMLLNRGEVLIDDLNLVIDNRTSILSNRGFESHASQWRILGNHVRSFITTEDSYSGARSLHLIATGHGDPGANRINQSISSTRAGTVTLGLKARWLKGTRFLLLRTSRERAPVQPPRPAHVFEFTMPMNLGTPGLQNTAFVQNRGPDIRQVKHSPVLPTSGEPVVITARITDNDGVNSAVLYYGTGGLERIISFPMIDDGSGDDLVAADGIFTATIPGAPSRTMHAFYIEATDGLTLTRFPTKLQPSADVPDRSCLVYVGDAIVRTQFATYRIWLTDDVIDTFTSRPNLSNELMDCTFVYNDSEVFYNTGIRFRGSPWLRSSSNRDPRGRYAYRIDFNPDQKFGSRQEINLDNTEGGNRGPLQERASYWFYEKMGLEFSSQEYVRVIINGSSHADYEDVQKIDGDYIRRWFPNDTEGYIHKIDDYFEYSAEGTAHSNLDEGLKYDNRHPLLSETYRWGFEKRSHRENDNWDNLFDFAVAMNTSSSSSRYEQAIESMIHPEHFAKVLALRHAVGDWDSYGYNRGKNNYFYYALPEGKWYLLPWDIDFTLGSGNGPSTNLFSVGGHFPEVNQFLRYPKYRQMYEQALADLVKGPWKTSYGTNNPPTAFDKFLDDAADTLQAEGFNASRRNSIKQFVRDRRNYIIQQIPAAR